MDAFVYVDPVNSNLVCCICRNPFVAPTTASPCGHTFCRACIDQALDVAQCCPIDRGQLSSADLVPAPPLVRNMVDELVVQCPNATLGCPHTAQRHLISSHRCTYVPVPCSAPSCSQIVLQHHANAHKDDDQVDCPYKLVLCPTCNELAPSSADHLDPAHPQRCPARQTTCPHCSAPTPHNQLSQHSQSCSAAPTPCPLSSFGCTYTGPAHSLSTHSSTCPFEPLRPFLALTQSRITSLERTVSDLKRELDATKKSLGPWYKSAGSQASTDPEPPRFEFRPLVSRRRVSSPLHTSMFHFDDTETETSGARRRAGSGSSGLRVSSSVEGDSVPAELALDPFSHILPPSPTSAESQQQREAVPYIPPLSTNASLEHTLSTLRNSLVSLAASLDMAERRQEMVVTTESLRMHEEVGSMRAIVHGLRMQVSALVMERNVAMMGRMNAGRTATPTNNSTSSDRTSTNPERNEERWATETRYYNQHPPPPVNLAVPYSVRRQETNNKL